MPYTRYPQGRKDEPEMKVVTIGGGSSYTPELLEGFLEALS